jgi:hypothetical protein
MGYKFQAKIFNDIGYIADGYDSEKHIWMEYDTVYHGLRKQKEKDLIRQNRIIQYFELIGKPLNQFVRVDMTKPDRMGIAVVYRGN